MTFDVSDPRFSESPEHPVETRERRGGRGCLFWGCLTLALAVLVIFGGAVVAAYLAFQYAVDQYTSDKPMEIEAVELPAEEMQALVERFNAFEEALKSDKEVPDLVVSADELNALVSQNADLKGHVLFRIADGKVGGDVSIPMDQAPGGRGRYLNASADFNVSMTDGVLMVTLDDATVNGAPLPTTIKQALSNQNLAKEVNKDPKNAEVLRKFESLEVVGDKIILKARRSLDEPPVAAEIESMDEAAVPGEAAP